MKFINRKVREDITQRAQRLNQYLYAFAFLATALRALRLKKIYLVLAISLLPISVSAQDNRGQLKFDLSVRYRFELWNGMNPKNYGDESPEAIGNINDMILLQRIIPGITYKNKNLNATFHLQDSRAFGWSLRSKEYPDLFKIRKTGTESPFYTMNPQEEFFDIYDLYVEYKNLFKNLTIKAGRQKIYYGDYRVFGPGDWGNTGRWTWDALKVSYNKNGNFADVFAGGTKIHDPEKISIPFTQTEFWGGGMYAHINIPKVMNVEPFYAKKTEGSADYINSLKISRNWTGIRVFNDELYHFILDLTAVKEFGSENGKTIDAFGWFAKVGYQFHNLPAKPIISIRESYASGGKKSDAVIHTFDPAYGAGDKYYGWMNITAWSNLDDREIVLELFPIKGMWIEIKYNRFYIPSPDDMTLLNTMKLEVGKNHFGDEFDTFIRYQALKRWQLTGAFGYFIPGDLQPINFKNPKDSYWVAFQVLFTLN